MNTGPLSAIEHESIVAARLKTVVRVDEPVTLITQAPRSGGTLMLRLFDGHPECNVFPHEAEALFKSPVEDLADRLPELFDDRLSRFLERGGFQLSMTRLHGDDSVYPLLLPPGIKRELYAGITAELEAPTPRQLVDSFFTAYFNAWLDHQNLRSLQKRWTVAFAPGMVDDPPSLGRFWELYPDGRVISIVRDPWTWYASAKRWSRDREDLPTAMKEWRRTTRAILRMQAERPDAVRIVSFTDLLRNTKVTMASVAEFLGIASPQQMRKPTLNGMPVGPNSSFASSGKGVDASPLRARPEVADRETAKQVAKLSRRERLRLEREVGIEFKPLKRV